MYNRRIKNKKELDSIFNFVTIMFNKLINEYVLIKQT